MFGGWGAGAGGGAVRFGPPLPRLGGDTFLQHMAIRPI